MTTGQPGEGTSMRAVVTGASSGIGEATVVHLCALGWQVYAVARREDRLRDLAKRTGAIPVVTDITQDDDVAALAVRIQQDGPLHALVNNAGGALGTDSVENGKLDQWQTMYETNVLGTLRVTQALLPALRG